MLDFRYCDKPRETTPDFVRSLSPKKWICNAKYDGWRMPTYVRGPGNVQCLSSVGNPMESTAAQYDPCIAKQFKSIGIPSGSVIDSEFVGPRGHLTPAVYIFDILAWAGDWLINEPYQQRWNRCQELMLPVGGMLNLAETVEDDFMGLFDRLKAGWDGKSMYLYEGIVVKARYGKLQLNRKRHAKSDFMVKTKFRDNRRSLH